MVVSTAKWTLAEYRRMVETGLLDDRQVELIQGEIVEMAPEGEPHAYFSSELGATLTRLLGDRALVRPAKPISLPDFDSQPEPDLAIVQPLGREYLDHHPYPENIFWVVEYADTSLDKDATVKYHLYAAAGIAEYWLVNLRTRELIVHRDPRGDEYGAKMTLTQGAIAALAFPEIEIDVAAIVSP
jgi:Uma2 family endonuclease